MQRVITGHKNEKKKKRCGDGWEENRGTVVQIMNRFKSPTVEEKNRKICKRAPQAFTRHRCCIVWFWLASAL